MVTARLKKVFARKASASFRSRPGATISSTSCVRPPGGAVEVVLVARRRTPPASRSGCHALRDSRRDSQPAVLAHRLRARAGSRNASGSGIARPRRPARVADGVDPRMAGHGRAASEPRPALPRLQRSPHPARRHPRRRSAPTSARPCRQGRQARRAIHRPGRTARPARRWPRGRCTPAPKSSWRTSSPAAPPAVTLAALPAVPTDAGRHLSQPAVPRTESARHRARRGCGAGGIVATCARAAAAGWI